jgi:elongation factor Ts
MVEINATQVKELREATNVSMMECKKALTEAGGDMAKATKFLRERGMAVAAKKASRVANQGLVASGLAEGGRVRALVEVNCETDFVAKNDSFKAFVADMAGKACQTDGSLADQIKDALTAKIAEIGENLVVRRNIRYVQKDKGGVASYIHLNSKIGVLVELACQNDATQTNEVFLELLRDITLQITAAAPPYLTSRDVPPEVIASEREIYAKQVKDKPAQIVDKIVDGKMKKFYTDTCLVDQIFVKDTKMTITNLLAEKSKLLGDSITIRRFVRYQLGQ